MRDVRAASVLLLFAACQGQAEPAPARAALRPDSELLLTAPEGRDGDRLGFAVAVDGDTIVAGAYGDDERGLDAGAAYVFVRDGWTYGVQAKLVASDGSDGDYFGWAVAVHGDTAVVGARRDGDRGSDHGSAYVFTREGDVWREAQKLVPSDGAPGDRFGWSVAVFEDTLVVGSPTHDATRENSGAAYAFAREGDVWREEAKLVGRGGFVGQSVALEGDTALVGADEDSVDGVRSGAAYVFVRRDGGWETQARIAAADRADGDYFGEGVALDGDTAVIGAWGRDDRGEESGGAYVFVREGAIWWEGAKLVAGDGAGGDRLGRAVALAGGRAVVGAYGGDRAYEFERRGLAWEAGAVTAPSGEGERRYGYAVAVSADRAVIGAPSWDGTTGGVFVYGLRGGGSDAGMDAGIDAGSAIGGRRVAQTPPIVLPDDATLDGGLDASIDSDTPELCTCRAAGAPARVPSLPLALLAALTGGCALRRCARRRRRSTARP